MNVSAVVLALLGVWFLLSLCAQCLAFQHWMRWLKARDFLALIPSWHFFAHPGEGDLHLLYRDQLDDGRQFTPWQEVELGNPSLGRVLYHPRRRRVKAVTTACMRLEQLADEHPTSKVLFVSRPYLCIATYIMGLPRKNGSHARQFLLADTSGPSPETGVEIVFLSLLHPFEERSC